MGWDDLRSSQSPGRVGLPHEGNKEMARQTINTIVDRITLRAHNTPNLGGEDFTPQI